MMGEGRVKSCSISRKLLSLFHAGVSSFSLFLSPVCVRGSPSITREAHTKQGGGGGREVKQGKGKLEKLILEEQAQEQPAADSLPKILLIQPVHSLLSFPSSCVHVTRVTFPMLSYYVILHHILAQMSVSLQLISCRRKYLLLILFQLLS